MRYTIPRNLPEAECHSGRVTRSWSERNPRKTAESDDGRTPTTPSFCDEAPGRDKSPRTSPPGTRRLNTSRIRMCRTTSPGRTAAATVMTEWPWRSSRSEH